MRYDVLIAKVTELWVTVEARDIQEATRLAEAQADEDGALSDFDYFTSTAFPVRESEMQVKLREALEALKQSLLDSWTHGRSATIRKRINADIEKVRTIKAAIAQKTTP